MFVARSNIARLFACTTMIRLNANFDMSDCNLSATFAASWGTLRNTVRLTFTSQLIKS
ncbi:hypothetical protein LINGRAHAP2_LOCUS30638 [Linum grandiflorum]